MIGGNKGSRPIVEDRVRTTVSRNIIFRSTGITLVRVAESVVEDNVIIDGHYAISVNPSFGTGIDGRVTRQDVMRYVENPSAYTAPPPPSSGVVGVEPRIQPGQPAEPAPDRRERAPAVTPGAPEPLSATRRTIARRMLESHQTIPVAWMERPDGV